jgi:hypothetical protein
MFQRIKLVEGIENVDDLREKHEKRVDTTQIFIDNF